jgi:hypothetical protein
MDAKEVLLRALEKVNNINQQAAERRRETGDTH